MNQAREIYPTKTKICFTMDYHYTERVGGAEVQAWLLAKELARRGFQVSYIAHSLNGKSGEIEIIDRIMVYWIKHHKYFDFRHGWQYYKTLKNISPDLLVQRFTSFSTGVIGCYAKIHKKKFVWICTDNSWPLRWAFLKRTKRNIRNGRYNFVQIIYQLLNSLIDDLARHYGTKFVSYPCTQNEYQHTNLRNSFKLNSHRVISGHDIPSNNWDPANRLKNKSILWVGNLGIKKRPEKFIQLAQLMKNKKYNFVMIGGHEDKKRVKDVFLNRPNNLLWLHRIPYEDNLEYFNQSTLLVDTSKIYGLGFPNTFIQAWMRGVPVVKFGMDPDNIIVENQLGIVSDNLSAIANAISSLLSDRKKYFEMSKHVIEFAKEHFTIKAAVDNFLRIVESDQE